jgi:membrane-associated phospholipid phosphatase
MQRADRLDVAIYASIARADTPRLDRFLPRLSRAANYGRLWLGSAAVLSLLGGPRGRRAAADGIASIVLTSAVVNAALKPLGRRRRPDVVARDVPVARHIRMPITSAFPSGHAASAFAFSAGVGARAPAAAIPLHALAALVSYSRVHTGVHYPGDVVAGALVGIVLARITTRLRA